MPGSGPYEYDRENSKKGNEGYVIMKRREDWWAKNRRTDYIFKFKSE